MFVNAINNFNVTNAFKTQALKDNEGPEKPTPTEPKPEGEEAPKMRPALAADTISFGANNKQRKANMAKAAAAAAIISSPISLTNCADYESYHSLSTKNTINLANYHKCPIDSIPVIIYPGCNCNPNNGNNDGCDCDNDSVGNTGNNGNGGNGGCNCNPDSISDDCQCGGNHVCDPDTVWITNTDTIYIEKENVPHYEINDSINKDVDDFDIPSEGEGDFVYAMTGRNEYLGANHALVFNGFFSHAPSVSSFVDHAFEDDDLVNGKPSKYYYTRYDISSVPGKGARYVKIYTPAAGINTLPNDKALGESGWQQTGAVLVRNKTVDQIKQLIVTGAIAEDLKAKYTKNTYRGPGNIYKEWPLNDGQMPKTTIQNVKVYRKNINDIK